MTMRTLRGQINGLPGTSVAAGGRYDRFAAGALHCLTRLTVRLARFLSRFSPERLASPRVFHPDIAQGSAHEAAIRTYNHYHGARKTFRSRIDSRATGFTLIEVVIVMAIIAILALFTVPVFLARIPRAQVEESMPLAEIAKRAVAAYYAQSGALPANNDAAGLPEAKKIIGNYVTAVAVTDGAINMTFGNNSNAKINGKRVTWRPAIVKDARVVPVAWICAGRKVPDGMDVGGVNVTDVPLDSLPVDCR